MKMYLWFKSFHLISMVAWFAGLFYIFRLFVYHVKSKGQKNMEEAYSLMEKKLLYQIMHPAMFLTILFGGILVVLNPDILRQKWFYTKLVAVVLLIAYHDFAGRVRKRFLSGDFFLSEKACRIINEVPTLLLIVIVILAVVRP